jgi:hypothetical protein
MQKTVNDLFEVYRPKSPDEQKFVDKHVVIKHRDRSGVAAPGSKKVPDEGNGDDVFKATNIASVDRQPAHGYNPGEDEKVYEEVELTEADMKDHPDVKEWAQNLKKQHKIAGDIMLFMQPDIIHAYHKGKLLGSMKKPKFPMRQALMDPERQKVRMQRKAVRRLPEEIEAINEVSPPGKKAEAWIKSNKQNFIDQYGEKEGTKILYAKAWKMFGEQKLYTKDDIINRAIQNYVTEDEAPPSLDEQMISRVAHLRVGDADMIYQLFNALNEDNKKVMIRTADTLEGVNSLLDFAIQNRGK